MRNSAGRAVLILEAMLSWERIGKVLGGNCTSVTKQ